MNAYLYSALARVKARLALKRNFSTALRISFISDLPSLLAQVFGLLALSPVISKLLAAIFAYDEGALLEVSRWTPSDILMLADRAWLVPALVLLGISLLTPFLQLGAVNSQLKLLRQEEIAIPDVLSRLSAGFRAIGLMICRAVMMIVW